jgi:hypothetical protein
VHSEDNYQLDKDSDNNQKNHSFVEAYGQKKYLQQVEAISQTVVKGSGRMHPPKNHMN